MISPVISCTGGSSPLARGLHNIADWEARQTRIIPARAGFTSTCARVAIIQADHPRSRGVYLGGVPSRRIRGGSSPLARGLHWYSLDKHLISRIIPARAGFTSSSAAKASSTPDHPRSRGVYPGRCHSSVLSFGSSPLARGLRPWGFRVWGPIGIIPARAGFTTECQAILTTREDHPRSRGVYLVVVRESSPDLGSSPLARGLHRNTIAPGNSFRIIPARAGFTCISITCGSTAMDHPRSRGVYPRGEDGPPPR